MILPAARALAHRTRGAHAPTVAGLIGNEDALNRVDLELARVALVNGVLEQNPVQRVVSAQVDGAPVNLGVGRVGRAPVEGGRFGREREVNPTGPLALAALRKSERLLSVNQLVHCSTFRLVPC